jgi:hypothetical protein
MMLKRVDDAVDWIASLINKKEPLRDVIRDA